MPRKRYKTTEDTLENSASASNNNSGQSLASVGTLLIEGEPALSVQDGQSLFFDGNRVKFSLQSNGNLHAAIRKTNELRNYMIETQDIVRKLKLTHDDVEANNREIQALIPDVEKMVPGSAEDLIRLHAVNGKHKEYIQELEGILFVTVDVTESYTITELPPGQLLNVPFHTKSVVWCPAAIRQAVVVESARSYRKQVLIGDAFAYGMGVNQNLAEGLRRWRLAADSNNELALAHCLRYGRDINDSDDKVSADQKEAFRLYQKLACEGHPAAMKGVGCCLEHGYGTDRNLEEAQQYYLLAAEGGHAGAQNNLGYIYEHGIGTSPNPIEAAGWYRLACDQGFTVASNNLGSCYERGIGVAKNEKEAIRLYRLGAESGNVGACYNLGNCYRNGVGVDVDLKEATKLYRFACDAGLKNAYNALGYCYQHGLGVEKDEKESARLYQMGAERGDVGAQINLAHSYQSGMGVSKDLAMAVEWFRVAADKKGVHSAVANSNLGYCYEHGIGVAKNVKEAVAFYQLAAKQGYAIAQSNLGHCFRKGIGVTQNEIEAVRWYHLAAQQGVASAQFNLGFCYEHGVGVAKNEKEAKRLYRLAAEQGNIDAEGALVAAATFATTPRLSIL